MLLPHLFADLGLGRADDPFHHRRLDKHKSLADAEDRAGMTALGHRDYILLLSVEAVAVRHVFWLILLPDSQQIWRLFDNIQRHIGRCRTDEGIALELHLGEEASSL